MAITNLYSKRQRQLRGEVPEVFSYDSLPQTLRVQTVQIIKEALGENRYGYTVVDEAYEYIHSTLCREYGVFTLWSQNHSSKQCVIQHILTNREVEKVIDAIELTFKLIDRYVRVDDKYLMGANRSINCDDAINELNTRFKENAIGFQFVSGEIIRLDSTFTHSEVVIPVLTLLSNKKFKGANDEYLNAHEHYRHGRNKECLVESLKAFESVMKIICKEKNWSFNENDTAKKLIEVVFTNGLVPTYLQNQFTSLRTLLETGVPTVRNKLGGHGQGQMPVIVDENVARYALNLAGANVIFLIELSGMT